MNNDLCLKARLKYIGIAIWESANDKISNNRNGETIISLVFFSRDV